jgi:hypothetical protein
MEMFSFELSKKISCGDTYWNRSIVLKEYHGTLVNKIVSGNRWLKGALTEAAWAASRAKETYLQARYQRLVSRRGKKRAILAIAHTILIMAYHIIKERCPYRELGANYFDRLNEQRLIKRLKSRIETLGYNVDMKKLPEAA